MEKNYKDDTIIEMEELDDGVYHPIVPYRRPNPELFREQKVGNKKIALFYEFLEGFVIGLEAMERFIRTTRRISKNWFERR